MTIQKTPVVAVLALFCCLYGEVRFPVSKSAMNGSPSKARAVRCSLPDGDFLCRCNDLFLVQLQREKTSADEEIVHPFCLRTGVLQTTIQYFFFLSGSCQYDRSQGIDHHRIQRVFCHHHRPFSDERGAFTWKKAIGCIVGFAGVVVVNLTPGAWDSGFAWNGEGFVLLCAVAYGASTVTTKLISKRKNRRPSPHTS